MAKDRNPNHGAGHPPHVAKNYKGKVQPQGAMLSSEGFGGGSGKEEAEEGGVLRSTDTYAPHGSAHEGKIRTRNEGC